MNKKRKAKKKALKRLKKAERAYLYGPPQSIEVQHGDRRLQLQMVADPRLMMPVRVPEWWGKLLGLKEDWPEVVGGE